LRRLRTEWSLTATVFGLVLLSTFVFAAIPRLFNEMSDDGLEAAVRGAAPISRNLEVSHGTVIPPGDAGQEFAPVGREGAAFLEDLPEELQSIIGDSSFLIDLPLHDVVDPPDVAPFPLPRYLTLRYHEEFEQHLDLTQGRLPQRTAETIPIPSGTGGARDATNAQLYEIAISSETASQLGVSLGDRLILAPHGEDLLVRRVPQSQHRLLVVEVVGIIEVRDIREDYWMNFPALNRATEYDDGNTIHIYATALMAREAYPQLVENSRLMFMYRWRYFVDPDAFDAGNLDAISADLRKLEAEYGASSSASVVETAVRTGLPRIFRGFVAQRRTTEAILSLTSVGLLTVALAVFALLAALIAERRRDTVALIRGRGGAPRQILASQVAEGALFSLPAAAVGLSLALLVVPGRASRWSLIAALGTVAVTTLLLYLAARPIARRHLGLLERGDVTATRLTPRRLVLEGVVVGLAVAGVYLLRRRGLTGDSSTDELSAFDPYLAAVPVLLGLATGVVVLRLYPIPVRVFAWVAALRRDLVPVLGFRRVARHPGVANLPLLVLLLSVAVAVFSSVMLHTIASGQVESSWQRVGADYRISAGGTGYLSQRLDIASVAGVEILAAAYEDSGVVLASRSPVFGTVHFLAVEVDGLEQVNDGTPADPDFPADMTAEVSGSDIGSAANPIPVLVSSRIGSDSIGRGDTFSLKLLGRDLTFFVVGTREKFAGIPVDARFVIAPFDALQAVNPDRVLRSTDLFIRAPSGILNELETYTDEHSPAAQLTSRSQEFDKVNDAPLINGVARGFQIGLVITGIYSALAITVALVLTGHERLRDLAYLRTMGLTRQQALGLTVVEQFPQVVLALAAGIVLGIGVARLIEPGLDLTAFTGPGMPVELRVDWLSVTLVALGVIVVVAGAIALTAAIARRASLGQALRLGEQ
jgi:putative ABC transport system permease protein